jgi:hypothetical protein
LALAAFVLLVIAAAVGLSLLVPPPQPPKPPAAPPELGYVPPKGYVCYRATQPVPIDGRLDGPAWRDAPWTDDFVDIEGDKKAKPRYRTRVKMLWDDEYFYVGAELEEPHVWATLTKHDSYIFKEDNDFEVFIDPDGDSHEYFEFEINARNTGWDLFLPRPYRDGGRPLDNWDITGLKTAVHVDGTLNDPTDTDKAWSVVMAFPWRVLAEMAAHKGPPHDGEQWRVNFSRVQWRHDIVEGKYLRKKKEDGFPEDNWVWSPQGVVDMHQPELWGYVQFSTGKPGTVAFRPDEAGPARFVLYRIYRAQHDHFKQHGRYAKELSRLGLAGLTHPSLVRPPTLQTTDLLFQAEARVRDAAGKTQRWVVRQDSRVGKVE